MYGIKQETLFYGVYYKLKCIEIKVFYAWLKALGGDSGACASRKHFLWR